MDWLCRLIGFIITLLSVLWWRRNFRSLSCFVLFCLFIGRILPSRENNSIQPLFYQLHCIMMVRTIQTIYLGLHQEFFVTIKSILYNIDDVSVISLEISIGRRIIAKSRGAKLNTWVNGPDGDFKCQIWTEQGGNQYFYLNCPLSSLL